MQAKVLETTLYKARPSLWDDSQTQIRHSTCRLSTIASFNLPASSPWWFVDPASTWRRPDAGPGFPLKLGQTTASQSVSLRPGLSNPAGGLSAQAKLPCLPTPSPKR